MSDTALYERIKKLLGYPITSVELQEQHFNEAFEIATETLKIYKGNIWNDSDVESIWVFKYATAICKEILGRIRGKYDRLPIPGEAVQLDAAALLKEAEIEKKELTNLIKQKNKQK